MQNHRIICIHQPPFLPWLGIIESLLVCDVFVIYDDVQFTYGGYQNRNKILTHHGPMWLTIPIKHQFGQHINEVEIAQEFNPTKILKTLQLNYANAHYFTEYFPIIENLFNKKYEKLIDLNMEFLRLIKSLFQSRCQFIFSSQLNIKQQERSERLAILCHQLQCNTYYSGSGTKQYIQTQAFDELQIKIVWHDYETRHAVYPQCNNHKSFMPLLSFVDMLFNCGARVMQETLLLSGQKKLLEYGIKFS